MSNSTPSNRKFYVIELTEGAPKGYLLGDRFAMPKTRKEFEGKFSTATDEQVQLLKGAGYTYNAGTALVIHRRADARKMIAALKAESPSWASDYLPVLREAGEFARHRDPRPIINWRVEVSKVPDGSTIKPGTVMQNGFVTREAAREYIKRASSNDKVYVKGYEYEALPNYGNI